MPDPAAADVRWASLTQSIIRGTAIDVSMLAPVTPFWTSYIAALAGRTWRNLSFFEIEFLFYHAINSCAGHFETGVDVFSATRSMALREALPAFQASLLVHKPNGPHQLVELIRLATTGNFFDYSQSNINRDATMRHEPLLVDHTAILESYLSARRTVEIHLLADNAGSELCWDLALIDAILCSIENSVVLHVKPWPMFVSDARPADVTNTIDAFLRVDANSESRALGERLAEALAIGRLRISAHHNWGEPRHISGLELDLLRQLRGESIVISKGDLNYRRFVEDREWPPSTAVPDGTVAPDMLVFALRVLKSDAVIGIPEGIVSKLARIEPEWRSDGRYAIVQSIGRED